MNSLSVPLFTQCSTLKITAEIGMLVLLERDPTQEPSTTSVILLS